MKKLIFLLLLITAFSYSQNKQLRVIYEHSQYTKNGVEQGWKDSENMFFYNYGGEEKIKIYKSNGEQEIYVQVGNLETGYTKEGNIKWKGGTFRDTRGVTIFFQLFDDMKYGLRMIFQDSSTMMLVP